MALSVDNRLRRPAEFKNVLNRARGFGGRAGDRFILLAGIPNTAARPRVGLSVGKRVGGAVTRNRVKRRLREIFRELLVSPGELEQQARSDVTNWDYVASARPDAADATYEELRASAERLISKVKARRER